MINNIQEHHNDEEIELIRLQNDVIQWKLELDFVAQEIDFYLDIFNYSLTKRKKVNHVDPKYLYDQFHSLQRINKIMRQSCKEFLPKLEQMNECEDIQCDHAYINAQLLLRSKIEKHLKEVRIIKNSAFTYLKNGIEQFLN